MVNHKVILKDAIKIHSIFIDIFRYVHSSLLNKSNPKPGKKIIVLVPNSFGQTI